MTTANKTNTKKSVIDSRPVKTPNSVNWIRNKISHAWQARRKKRAASYQGYTDEDYIADKAYREAKAKVEAAKIAAYKSGARRYI